MGFIRAFAGAVGGTFADQWVDFYTVPAGIAGTAALFPAVQQGQNRGRGSNTRGSSGIITNGSRIIVPEGYGLVTMENGAFTGLVAEAGGYVWESNDQNSKSMFTGGGLLSSTVKTSWERFKFGGMPGAQQAAYFVTLKELPNNRFGTQSEIYWDDAYLNAQVGAVTRGSYTMRIVDPLLFIRNFVPAKYLTGDAVFDFTDMSNDAATQLFNEVVSSLAPAFSNYTNDPSKGNRMARIQGDSLGFAQSLSGAVEAGYNWESQRGLKIISVAIQSIEYDETTRALLADVQKADALGGARGNSFMQQAAARGVQAAGETGGGAGLAMFGMGAQGIGLGGLSQPAGGAAPGAQPGPQFAPPAASAAPAAPAQTDLAARLTELKGLLDAGIITQEDFDAAKAKALGL